MTEGSSVTLIFYKISSQDWWKEPALNLVAAAAQFSTYTHVELSIGEASGTGGQMANVVRIYNDNMGVELCQRTGRNPQYTYLSLGCSRAAEQRMLAFAKQQIGKPFSNFGMARSLIFPRQSDNRSFYCAELVAAVLKAGGMLSIDSNPGSATPHSLYKLYSKQAAATANPYMLRQSTNLSLKTVVGQRLPHQTKQHLSLMNGAEELGMMQFGRAKDGGQRRRSDSPPRASFKVLSAAPSNSQAGFQHLGLSLMSLRG